MFLVLLDIILLLIIIQFAYIKIAFEMYGQYHLPHGKNPALSCLIGFVSMDRAKQQKPRLKKGEGGSFPARQAGEFGIVCSRQRGRKGNKQINVE